MGSSPKKPPPQRKGFKYYAGMHMGLCYGPIDSIFRIYADERIAWEGSSVGGRVDINAEGLFGGEDREGGISGAVDLEFGSSSQGKNDYLQSQLGSNIPSFRGLCAAVFRKCYFGTSPYFKPLAFRAQRVFKRG